MIPTGENKIRNMEESYEQHYGVFKVNVKHTHTYTHMSTHTKCIKKLFVVFVYSFNLHATSTIHSPKHTIR